MKKFSLVVFALFFVLLVGCSRISENNAEQMIIEEYSNHLGETTILSTVEKDNEYFIEWENKNDKSNGTNKVSTNGELTIIEMEIE